MAIDLDIAVAEHLTWTSFRKVMLTPYTWLPALMYMTTFGFELAVDANLANVLFASHSKEPGFGQVKAGYCESDFLTRNGFATDRDLQKMPRLSDSSTLSRGLWVVSSPTGSTLATASRVRSTFRSSSGSCRAPWLLLLVLCVPTISGAKNLS